MRYLDEVERIKDEWRKASDAETLHQEDAKRLRARLAAAEARAERLAGVGSVILQHYDGFKARNGHIDDTVEMAALRAALAEGEAG